jgi:GNAT superfamily N-acetyltransferase
VEPINPANAALLLNGDPRRERMLAIYLERGYTGVLTRNGAEAAAFGWLSEPSQAGPFHLAESIQRLPNYWIFNCWTAPAARGRGLFKVIVATLCNEARARMNGEPDAVFIDTTADNLPARRAILDSGFQPAGVVTTCILGIPRVRWWKWSRWDRSLSHPELPPTPAATDHPAS